MWVLGKFFYISEQELSRIAYTSCEGQNQLPHPRIPTMALTVRLSETWIMLNLLAKGESPDQSLQIYKLIRAFSVHMFT